MGYAAEELWRFGVAVFRNDDVQPARPRRVTLAVTEVCARTLFGGRRGRDNLFRLSEYAMMRRRRPGTLTGSSMSFAEADFNGLVDLIYEAPLDFASIGLSRKTNRTLPDALAQYASTVTKGPKRNA
jgi:hypothetical protein